MESIEKEMGHKIYICRSSGADAEGRKTESGFLVVAESIISAQTTPSFPIANKGYFRLREELIRDGVIKDRVFQQDYEFSSATAAASVICGRTASGKKHWKEDV